MDAISAVMSAQMDGTLVFDIVLLLAAFWGAIGFIPRKIGMADDFAHSTLGYMHMAKSEVTNLFMSMLPPIKDRNNVPAWRIIAGLFVRVFLVAPTLLIVIPLSFPFGVIASFTRVPITLSAASVVIFAGIYSLVQKTTQQITSMGSDAFEQSDMYNVRLFLLVLGGMGFGDCAISMIKVAVGYRG
eukprot:CAMPEP_0113896118 /NCGR_PEP_ID=MMETSP0780_2-20120614/17801_1 /TAXON_ID=652834 /ORGANISM="Palpitomonas bilix" /LENGTH=185 /DNA_ID=CAMNT_0000887145 /DNA_START=1 /DNA_END=558 /DNA_ORIENTATION=- /assembly_acc=CAM_ASM_000599